MYIPRNRTIPEIIYGDIMSDEYLLELYNIIEKYQDLLEKGVSPQKLSIAAGLKDAQKRAIITSLVANDFEMKSRPKDTTLDEFSFMRKQALIFVRDLKSNRNSCVVSSLRPYATDDEIRIILENAKSNPSIKGLDVSPDQIITLAQFIKNGNKYPSLCDNEISYDSALDFMFELSKVFKWRIYERKTLGYGKDDTVNTARIKMYTNILHRWMSGHGLSSIILAAIRYRENHASAGLWLNNIKVADSYDKNDPKHKNYVIADTLNIIENVVLFSIANYFREFSTEYKKQHGNQPFDNDWYEYVEFGTTNELTIVLQRYGYSREASTYIIKHINDFIDRSNPTPAFPFMLRKSALLECGNSDVVTETPEIHINVPELFIE